MKKILLVITLLLSFAHIKAQVSYGDNFLVDYNVKINLTTENSLVFLVVILKSERYKMTSEPKLLLRLMDNTVISLNGELLDSTSKYEGSYMIGNVSFAENLFITEAKFPISKEQVESLSKGVKKLRLNTLPKYHEREWEIDKIGKKLYKKYKDSSSNSFEDDF